MLACLVSLANAAARTGGLFSIVPLLGSLRLGLSVTAIGFALAVGTLRVIFSWSKVMTYTSSE